MTDPLSFTGERFTPECGGEIWYEHWHRYALIRTLARGREVLDVASGEGYGSAMLAAEASRVTGVDLSAEAVAHARQRYAHQSKLDYVCASCTDLPFPDASFDLVVSFETLEHIDAHQAFINEVSRVLRPGGLFIVSSPNKRLYSDARDYHNEFHVKELYREELEALLAPVFPHRRWMGQRLMFHSMAWAMEAPATAPVQYLLAQGAMVDESAQPDLEAMYYLVLCSRAPLQAPAALSLFSDAEGTVYQDYERQTRRVIELDGLLIAREKLIAERDAMLALRTEQMDEREKLIAERDAMLALRTEQMVQHEGMIRERDARLEAMQQQLNKFSDWRYWLIFPFERLGRYFNKTQK